jgi:hypothetical protein
MMAFFRAPKADKGQAGNCTKRTVVQGACLCVSVKYERLRYKRTGTLKRLRARD